ncbi:MAG: heme ABC exporter ATP-binding protein CcmA [Phycisphaerales bacterium]|nr:MAG: heme ABC exporter ATP-binding protein CcmA [Phycisphaerales bacterium]
MITEAARSTDMALTVRSVSKAFTARPVLRDVSVALRRGQAACLYGINGAGKSTLLRIAAGLLRPDAGSVWIEGNDVREHPDTAKRCLGVISHASMVYSELTVLENLRFAGELYRVSDRAARIEQLLTETGLGPFRYDRAGILSRGLLQRLAIARALLHEPTVLLADEPFTGLDVQASEHLIGIFDTFARRGGTILMTTHDTRLGLRCCERVVVLDQGAALLDKTKDEIDPERFAEDYLSYARSQN